MCDECIQFVVLNLNYEVISSIDVHEVFEKTPNRSVSLFLVCNFVNLNSKCTRKTLSLTNCNCQKRVNYDALNLVANGEVIDGSHYFEEL